MRICIVDDEQNCIDNLESLILKYGQEKEISMEIKSFSDGPSFIKDYIPDTYDIVFLDIYIGDVTGMDLAKHVRSKSENGMIIFCTTSLSDMPEAFRYHAFEYIIKPAEYQRIERVLDDAIAILPKLEKYIKLPSNEGKGFVAVSSISSVTTDGHYLDIFLNNGEKYTERMSLATFTELLEGDSRFLQINKGILVNMDRISTIKERTCVMQSGLSYPVKVRDSAAIRKFWQDYTFDRIRKGQANS